jgi:hypothetical protein
LQSSSHILHNVVNALHHSELFTAEEIDMHVDPLLERCNLRKDATDVKEGLDIAVTKNGGEALAEN